MRSCHVHFGKGDKVSDALAAPFGEDLFHEQIPLCVHVAESGGDEDADVAVVGW